MVTSVRQRSRGNELRDQLLKIAKVFFKKGLH